MKKKNQWLSAGLTLVMFCAMLLAPTGWGIIPGAEAGGPGTIQLTATASGQSIILNWTVASDTSGLSGYYIYRGTRSGGESSLPLNDFPVTQTNFTDTTVSSGTYYYFVKPVYDNGSTTGSPSNEASATVAAASSGVTIVLRVGQPTMTVNGAAREIDPGKGTAPAIVSGRVFLPISSIVQAMGGIPLGMVLRRKYLSTWVQPLSICGSAAARPGSTA